MLRKLALPLVLAALIACEKSPTGRTQFALLPSDYVAQLGAQSFASLQASKSIETNRRVNDYVACVAQAIIAELSGTDVEWEVVVFRDPSPNAFALPGGKIGVHTGLLRAAESADQLAAVIGHEIGHVLSEHANERMSQGFAVDAVLWLVNLFIGDQAGIADDVALQALGLGAEVGVLLPFSRAHESEADIIGLELMAQAGFDPRQALSFWKNMSQLSGKQGFEFLSTHPTHDSRITDLQYHMTSAVDVFERAQAQGRRPHCAP